MLGVESVQDEPGMEKNEGAQQEMTINKELSIQKEWGA